MSIFDRRDRRGASRRSELPLDLVVEALSEAVQVLEHGEVDAALLRAQLADRCRDAGVEPVAPEGFDLAVQALDAEAWRRLAALAAVSTCVPVEHVVAPIAQQRGAAWLLEALLGVVRGRPRLTMALLRMSPLRVEELARAWFAALGIAVTGERPAQSTAALERLDYERLLAQAEQARDAAEARMAQLKQAQEADDMRRTARRGKV